MPEMMKDLVLDFLIVFTLLSHGYLLGLRLVPRVSWTASFGLGCAVFIALQSIAQTAWYYVGTHLGRTSDLGSLVIAVAAVYAIFHIRKKKPAEGPDQEHTSRTGFPKIAVGALTLLVGFFGLGAVLRGAMNAATLESIRTPWPLLPDGTLMAIAAVWVAFFLCALFVRSTWLTAIQGGLAIFSTTTITPLLYRLGFGFDGFLHAASEKILLTSGTLTPKPFYYIGQYVFTTWLARLADIPIEWIDRWLVPAGAAFLIPLCVALAIPAGKTKTFGFAVLALLPLAGFITTTPQGFAYTLGLAALVLAYGVTQKTVHPLAPLILALWTVAIHPLAGVPILFVVAALLLAERSHAAFTIGSSICIVLAGISVPLLFAILSTRSGTAIAWNAGMFLNPQPWVSRLQEFAPWIGNRFVVWPAWATLTAKIVPLLLLLASLASFRKHRASRILVLSSIALLVAATALKATGDFTFLIDYERGNYANRLGVLAMLVLLPSAIPGLALFWERALRAPRSVLFTGIIFSVAIATALSYDSIPRHDALVTGRGWSTSQHDLEAVRLIDRDAGGRAYTVLANQSVSAAAVKVLGFKRYADDVFFYPIPTGGPLYETYLRMVYNEPSLDTVKDAARLGKTDLVYVVLNEYWWQAEAVSEALRDIADATVSIEGRVWVYTFDLSTDSSASTETSTR